MGDELKPVAWRNANGAVTNFTHGAEALEKAGIECEPLYPASALTALREERDGWMRAVGEFVATIPLREIVANSGTVRDTIDYFKALHSRATAAETEAATLRALLAEAEKAFDPIYDMACEKWSSPDDIEEIRAARAVSAKIKEITGE